MKGGKEGEAGGVLQSDLDVHVHFGEFSLGKDNQDEGGFHPEDVS